MSNDKLYEILKSSDLNGFNTYLEKFNINIDIDIIKQIYFIVLEFNKTEFIGAISKYIVNQIRTEKHLIGYISSDEKANIGLKNKNEGLQKALEDLAQKINSDAAHFILELIQNADDNDYINENRILKFIACDDKIIIQNNEKGFNISNVIAICDNNQSTKKQLSCYIGEKGIGFKSVFRITDEPCIFSNGFKFRLPKITEGGLGYIIPYWIDDLESDVDVEVTNIVLKFNNNANRSEIEKFDKIKAPILLFLRKIDRIEVENRTKESGNKIISRKKLGGGNKYVELTEKINSDPDKVSKWRIIEKTISMDGVEAEDKRKDIKQISIFFAFPIDNAGNPIFEIQKLYSFLPIDKITIFKFIVQADFMLNAGREDIIDNAWNIRIINNCCDNLIEAIEELKNDHNYQKIFYRYIPTLKTNIGENIFSKNNIIETLILKLRNTNCILSESGRYLKPDQIFRVKPEDEEVRILIPNDVLLKYTGSEYINVDIDSNEEVLDDLGLNERYLPQNFLEDFIMDKKNDDFVRTRDEEWFVKLYEYLYSKKTDYIYREKLKNLKIVKLQNGNVEHLKNKVFFDVQGNYGFENDMPVLNSKINELINMPQFEKAKLFLKDYLKIANPSEIIKEYILRKYESDKLPDNHYSHIKYLKDHLDYIKNNKALLGEIKNNFRLKVKNDEISHPPSKIYLSNEYRPEYNLEFLFSGNTQILLLSDHYIRNYNEEKEIASFKDFSEILGVNNKIIINTHEKFLTDKRRDMKFDCLDNDNDNVTRLLSNDHSSEHLESVLQNINLNKSKLLLKILNDNFDFYENYFLCATGNERLTQNTESVFLLTLKKGYSWLYTANNNFAKPIEIFIKTKEIEEIFGCSVEYINDEMSADKYLKLLKSIGVKNELEFKDIVDYIESIKSKKVNEIDIQLIKKIYHMLDNYGCFDIQLKEKEIVFIPGTGFVKPCNVFWDDNTEVFGKEYISLENFYPDHKRFFVEKLKVNISPCIEGWIRRLIVLSSAKNIDNELQGVIIKIYDEINRNIRFSKSGDVLIPDWQNLVGLPIVLTNESKFSCASRVYVSDHECAKRFFKHISFINDSCLKFKDLLRALNIRNFSDEVESVIDRSCLIGQTVISNDKIDKINSYKNYIISYISNKILANEFSRKKERIKSIFDNFKIIGLNILKVVYTIKSDVGKPFTEEICDLNFFVDHSSNILYVKNHIEINYKTFILEFSKFFKNIIEINDLYFFLLQIVNSENEEEIIDLFKQLKFNLIECDRIKSDPLEPEAPTIITPKNISVENDQNTYQHDDKPEEPPNSPENRGNTKDAEFDPYKNKKPSEAYCGLYEPEASKGSDSKIKLGKFPDIYCVKKSSKKVSEGSSNDNNNNKRKLNQSSKQLIARWGEEYVIERLKNEIYNELKVKYPGCTEFISQDNNSVFIIKDSEMTISEVIWMNEFEVNNTGFDIKVMVEGKHLFIEVKSTKTDVGEKEWFELSVEQWKYAKELQDSFQIYRVYNAGEDAGRKCRVNKLVNPYNMYLNGEIDIRPQIYI